MCSTQTLGLEAAGPQSEKEEPIVIQRGGVGSFYIANKPRNQNTRKRQNILLMREFPRVPFLLNVHHSIFCAVHSVVAFI